jgi:RNA recognition motif-containing protein
MMFSKQSIFNFFLLTSSFTGAFQMSPVSKRVSVNSFVQQTNIISCHSNNNLKVSSSTLASQENEAVDTEKKENSGFTAYVVNLSYETTNAQLREAFSEYGNVEKVFMPMNRDTGKCKGIAFVTMSTREELDASISNMDRTFMNERQVYVSEAKPRGEAGSESIKLYIGNISYDTTEEDIKELFQSHGVVKDIYIPTDINSGMPRGFAFLTMSKDEAEKAMEAADGMEFMGRTIEVKVSLPRGQKSPTTRTNRKSETTKLYIGNLPYELGEESVREMFAPYAPLIDVYLPVDQYSGRTRGFAFVTLGNEMADRAVEEMDGFDVDGRPLRVNAAQPKGQGSNGGGWEN